MSSPSYQPDLQEEELEQTQQTQLSTQQYSQAAEHQDPSGHLWGFLLPCSPRLKQLEFWRSQPSYTIGRGHDNAIRLPGPRISNKHCIVRWDGGDANSVVVTDVSTNGTFINGVKIGHGLSGILSNGSEIAFGSLQPQAQGDALEDYRFVFRFTALGPAREGLWAHYDVSHELGTGSFATVHKALSRRTGQFVAVKMIRSNKLAAPLPADPNRDGDRSVNAATNNRTSSFAREIQILSDLRHQNICQLIETFWTTTEISIVLELVEGGDLLEYILKREGLDETMSRFITYQLCDALAYIHGQGVAHRDLKPENVLLTKDDPPVVKVADFGLAKYIDSLTMLKTMCGTPSYLAPEVVQNNVNGYGHGVDSWSVGVIVFSMLTLQSPFIENEDVDIRMRIETRTTDWSMLHRCGISDVVQHFIRRLLEVQPDVRMTAQESLEHPWLLGAGDDLAAVREGRVPYPEPLPSVPQGAMSQDSIDVSMSILSEHGGNGIMADMSLDERGAAREMRQEQGAFHHPSTRHGLQRRSKVIADAESTGKKLPEIPEEMIAKANAENGVGPSDTNGDHRDVSMDSGGVSNLAAVPEEPDPSEQQELNFGSQPREPEHGVRRSKRTTRAPEPESTAVRGHGKHGASGAGTRTKRGVGRRVGDIQEEDEDMRETASPKKSRC